MEQQLVVFELSGEAYGVSISSVESIIKMQAITVVPHASTYVKGVTNLRGKVLPVIDLRKRFGLLEKEVTADNRIIVVSINGVDAGIVVDGVSEVVTVSSEVIDPAPAMATTVDSAFITGIAKLDGKLVILLDLGKVLSMRESAEVAHAAI